MNTGAAINTLNIVGGRIQNQIKNIGATTRNVFFDRRYCAERICAAVVPVDHSGCGQRRQRHGNGDGAAGTVAEPDRLLLSE